MRVLVACEFSGVVREAFRRRGHDAWSCDLLPAEDGSEFHIQGDVRDFLNGRRFEGVHIFNTGATVPTSNVTGFTVVYRWDLMIAHPPCTRLCNSGVRWLSERNLWSELDEAAEFFKMLLNAPIPRIAVENPVPHKYALERIGRKYDFTTQPYEHGDPYTKRTCFWLKNLPPLKPSNIVSERRPAVHLASPGPDRWRERSRTYPGLAEAMADQWGGL